MEVVVITGGIRLAKLQSNRHHQKTNTQLFTGRMALLLTNQQCQSTEGKSVTFYGFPHSELAWGSSNFVYDQQRLLVTLGEGCHDSRQPSDASISPKKKKKERKYS